jgi:hypothetical protein
LIATLYLNEQEIEALSGLLDAGVRHLGLRAAGSAAVIAQKLQQAVDESRAAPPSDPEERGRPNGRVKGPPNRVVELDEARPSD